jgi:sigma-B regulation protein RsbU (phosphoserine phosphatase)
MSQTDTREPTPAASVLVIDDDDRVRSVLVGTLRSSELYEIVDVSTPGAARLQLSQRAFDVVITDLSMPEEDGISLMQWGKAQHPDSSWIVLTGYGTMSAAVSALQLGAFDFLLKPLEMAQLINSVRNALAHTRLVGERRRLLDELEQSNEQLTEHVQQLEVVCQLLSEQAQTIQEDLQRAALIQQALLPRLLPEIPSLCIQSVYRPSQMVGGDLYDVVRLDEGRVGVMIADAAGHGLSAAMLAVVFRHQIPMFLPNSHTPNSPAEALSAVNTSLLRRFRVPGLFITAAYCVVDYANGSMRVASAGHPPLILQRTDGFIERVYHTGPALGLYPDACFAEQEIPLHEGDRLFLYTDGVYDHLKDGTPPYQDDLDLLLRRKPRFDRDLLQNFLRTSSTPETSVGDAVEDDVTMVMLTCGDHESRIDNGKPLPTPTPPNPRVDREAEILTGSDLVRTSLSIHGKATWIQSTVFYDACNVLIDDGKDMLLDFALCDCIDSTFLGTIHELIDRAEKSEVELRLQAVSPAVEHLFVELGMKQVIDHIVLTLLPLPNQMSPLVATDYSEQGQAQRVLRAHERLAELGERNREKFNPLIVQLRQEIASRAEQGGSS